MSCGEQYAPRGRSISRRTHSAPKLRAVDFAASAMIFDALPKDGWSILGELPDGETRQFEDVQVSFHSVTMRGPTLVTLIHFNCSRCRVAASHRGLYLGR